MRIRLGNYSEKLTDAGAGWPEGFKVPYSTPVCVSAMANRVGKIRSVLKGTVVASVIAVVVLSVMLGSAAGVAPKKGDNTVGFLHEKQVLSNGALTTEPLNWNSTLSVPTTSQSNSTFDNISGGNSYALQVLSGTTSISGESANTTWITLQDNVSSSLTVWVAISLAKMTFGSTTGFAGWGFIFIQSNSTGDYLGDSVVSNFTGALSSQLTKIESAYE